MGCMNDVARWMLWSGLCIVVAPPHGRSALPSLTNSCVPDEVRVRYGWVANLLPRQMNSDYVPP